jgi:threonine synthase
MYRSGAVKLGEKIDVCVPTGNFGNIFAAYIAKLMGAPIGKLVCASNKNNVLTDFLTDGAYDKNRPFHTTMSPSMDILISSNLERLLYLALGADKTRSYMQSLNENGKYRLTNEEFAKISEHFVGYYTDEEDCKATVKSVFEKKNRLIDTHTAVAVCAADRYMNDSNATSPMLVVSTASAYKFAADVLLSLSGSKPEDDLDALKLLEQLTGEPIPTPLSEILGKTPIHTKVIEKSEMKESVISFALD